MIEQSENSNLRSKDGTSISVTSEGSLGLLALGDIGLALWRQAISKEQIAKNESVNDKNGER